MENIKDIYLVLDNIRSLLNIGAIFRTADAAGVKKIFLCGISGYPPQKFIKKIDGVNNEPIIIVDDLPIIKYRPSKKCIEEFLAKEIKKTALAGLKSVEWEYHTNTKDLVLELKKRRVNIIALEQHKKSIDYRTADYGNLTAIIVGHERMGINNEILKLADQIVEMPMHGKGKSLNVATATGIILYKAIEK